MIFYTNKFPVLKNGAYVQPDGTIKNDSTEVLIEAGKVFKVVGMDMCGIFLSCSDCNLVVNPDMLSVGFTETDIDI